MNIQLYTGCPAGKKYPAGKQNIHIYLYYKEIVLNQQLNHITNTDYVNE